MSTVLSYTQPLYRPPAEANSLIIQVSLGCSFNNCAFCSMYDTKKYKVKTLEDIFSDFEDFKNYKHITRVFLADGDVLGLKTSFLLRILRYLKENLPNLRRVSAYASAFNLYEKTQDDLELLRKHNLSLIYFGIESGSFEVLKRVKKPVSQEKMIESLNKASKAKMKISATVILGLGGRVLSNEHILKTAEVINNTNITYLSTLQLILDENSYAKMQKGFDNSFEYLSDKEMLIEQKKLIENISPKNKIIFRSNHVSNSLALAGNLPRDKEKLLNKLENTLEKTTLLRPLFMRGL